MEPSWFPVACSQIQGVVFSGVQEKGVGRGVFGAVLVSVRWWMTGYRGPALASLWQK